MTTYFPAKKGVELIMYIALPSVASTSIFQSSPTIAAGDFKVSIDGAGYNNLSTLPAVTPAATKSVKVTLSASEMNGDNILFLASDAAGGEWKDVFINIPTTARQIDDLCYPTTTGRSLDVTATGAAGIDWNNIENPTTAVAFTGTTIATTQKVDVETIKTNPVVNAGTITFPTTATLASTTNITAGTIATVTNQLTAAAIATGVWTDTTAGDFTAASSIGKSVMNGVTLGTGLTINGYTGNTAQSGDSFARIGSLGAGLTAVPWNAAWDAEVESEVNDALVVHRLDELLNADSDIDGAAPPTVGSVFHELMTKTAGSFTYDQTTDSIEALRDRGDAAWITATGFSTLSAADVSDAVWNAATATYGSAGSYGLLVETNLDGTVTSRMATYTQPTGFLAATFPTGTVANTTNITAGTITTATNLTNAATNGDLTATMKTSVTTAVPTTAQNATAVLTTAMTESYAADGVAPTLAQAMFMTQQSLTEAAISGTTLTVKKLDGTTTAATFTLDSSVSPTSRTRAT